MSCRVFAAFAQFLASHHVAEKASNPASGRSSRVSMSPVTVSRARLGPRGSRAGEGDDGSGDGDGDGDGSGDVGSGDGDGSGDVGSGDVDGLPIAVGLVARPVVETEGGSLATCGDDALPHAGTETSKTIAPTSAGRRSTPRG